ncbi:MAG TPA: polyprenyl synthetase family protein, partial [Opitutus sp.]|nr:polyprenyl synthetase family protein [Opitutus sp.]
MDFSSELRRLAAQVEHGLDLHVPPADTPPARLHQAMRYSLEAGGKRLRPVLVLATAERYGVPLDRALPAAVALECLHTYSLIHDDLPCRDNDDLRRGRPTVHKAFDEATALLAGDALLTHAFALLATAYRAEPPLTAALVRELADAAGSRRLIGGQMADLLAEKSQTATASDLEFIHLNKTAAMIEAALAIGGQVGGASPPEIAA